MTTLKQKKLLLITILFGTLVFSMPFFANARGLVPCGGYIDAAGTQREPPCDLQLMLVLVARCTNFLIVTAGVYAVYKIIFAGFNLVVSMGEEEKITKNKGQITDAVVGFVLVMLAYILINTTVNVILLGSLPSTSPLKIDLRDPFKYLQNK